MSLQAFPVTNLPLYLPGDNSFTPFGDPFEDVTWTHASPGVFTVPGYEATNGDTLVFTTTGSNPLPGGFTANTQYFVVAASGDTFELSLTKGGGAISSTNAGTGATGVVVHFTASDAGIPAIPLPFKPGNTVVVANLTGGSLVLQGASDLGTPPQVGTNQPVYTGVPQGPGSWNTIATVPAGSFVEAQLGYDWIRVSTSATLTLLQS